jgi:hypothetical protein
MADIGAFAGIAVALYAAHHVGDYWVQTDHQAQHKGKPGEIGRSACVRHCVSYVFTQAFFMVAVMLCTDVVVSPYGWFGSLFISGVTHYLADRREYGIMFRFARMLPGKAKFLVLGVPRQGRDDNPSLGTGGWALDQSWHIFWGVFVAALVAVMI